MHANNKQWKLKVNVCNLTITFKVIRHKRKRQKKF